MKKKLSVFCSLLLVLSMIVPMAVMPVFAEGEDASGEKYTAPESAAVTYNLNVDWKFKRATVHSSLTNAINSVKDSSNKLFYEADFDDSDWADVSVPHPINAEDSFDDNCYDSGESGVWRGFMFYRKHVTIPAEDAGKKMFLEFEAVRNSVYLYVNGTLVGYYEAGIAATGFDITDYIKPGEDNIIAVATDNGDSRGQADKTNITTETKPGTEPGSRSGSGYQWNTKDFNEVQGGITGNVNLYAKGKVYQTLPLYNNLKTTGNYIYGTNYNIDEKSATINVKAELRNETAADTDVTLQVDVVGMDGNLAYSFSQAGTVKAATDADAHIMNTVPADAYDENPAPTDISTVDVSYITASFDAANMRFWSDRDPYLYTVYTILKDSSGNVIDVQEKVTGFRKVEYDINDGGLKINDKNVYLKGYAQRATNEWAVIGVANDWLTDIDMQLLKESNGNHIRWMHVAPKPVAVRASDKYGVIVVCPAGDKEGDASGRMWDQRVEAMRDAMIYFRNSPSVLFWEAGNNEITPDHMKEMTELRKKLDPDGGRFAGSRTINSVAQINEAEYVGTMENRHASGAKGSMTSAGKYLPIVETEYARDEAPRRVWDDYSPPDYDYVNKWLGPNGSKTDGYDIWDETSEDFAVTDAKQYDQFYSGRVGGGGSELYSGAAIMVWADSNMHNRNTGSENCRTSGKVDPVRIPKQAFYALQAVQSDTPKIHIVGHWNYPQLTDDTYWYEEKTFNGTIYVGTGKFSQRDPKKKTVYVIGSPDIKKVELYINGALVKTDSKPDNTFIYAFNEIDVTQSGEVSAKAYDETDTLVAEDVIKTAGEPDHLKLTPVTGPDGLIADGSDIMYYDVAVVDADDNVCPLSYDRIDLKVSGEGVLLGGYNSGVGDKNTTHKDYTYAECGLNRVFIRSTRNAGTITFTAQVAGLGEFTQNITSVPFENKVGTNNGLSTLSQRSYAADEKPPVVETKVEAFNPLAAAVKADFSENGNTKVVEEIDDTDYYTVTVNGKEVSFGTRPFAYTGSNVVAEVKPVLDALIAAGAPIKYSEPAEKPEYVVNGDLPVITVTDGIKADATIEGGAKLTQMDIAKGYTTVILNQGADQNLMDAQADVTAEGVLRSELKVMLGYLADVSTERDEVNKIYEITYGDKPVTTQAPVKPANPSAMDAELSYSNGKVTVKAGEEAISNAPVIFAVYKGGVLKAVDTDAKITAAAGETAEVAVPSEIFNADGDEIKAMIWRTLKDITPLAEAIEIDEDKVELQSVNDYDDDDDFVYDEEIISAEPEADYALFADEDIDYSKYEILRYSENYNTDTRTDGPDGTGYFTPSTTEENIFDSMDAILTSESIIALDFRFDNDDGSGSMAIRSSKGNWGPNLSYNASNSQFRTQTGSTSYQNLGAITPKEWYHLEIEGTMGVSNAFSAARLYGYSNGELTLIQETQGLNLRNLSGTSNGVARRMEVNPGISIDNVKITSLYASEVDVTALRDEINANESVTLTAIAKRKGSAVTVPEFVWTLHDENGDELTDETITISEAGMLFTTKDTKSQTVTVRATAQTEGKPYGETKIKVTAIDTSNDTFDSIELQSDKDFVRYGSDTTITPTASMGGAAVTPAAGDIVWSVYNEANIREVKNVGITVNNGVVSVSEDVIPQVITVRASNKSGSASASIQLNIKPGTMILDDEEGNLDTFVAGDACEELVTGLDLQEGSWDGTGYYKLSGAHDFEGFASNTTEHVLYSADMRFDQSGSGWTIMNANNGRIGMQVTYTNGKLGVIASGSSTPTYLDVDQTSWYNVQVMCSTGNENAYAHLVVYRYEDGKRVNPVTGEEGVPFVQLDIPMRNLSGTFNPLSPANHINISGGTSVDNVYCAKTTPDKITVSVDKDTMFAGQTIQGSAVASRQGVPFGYISSDLIKWVVYDANNERALGSDLIKVDQSGKLTVDALADSQTIYLRAATIDGSLYDAVKITIQSSDIFTVNTIGFDEDYTKVRALYVTKNFSYSDTVTFVVCVYDKDETTLKSVTTRRLSAKSIARSDEPVAISMNAEMPDGFDKNSDVVYVYTVTSLSENESVKEADGTIAGTISGNNLTFSKVPELDASRPVIVMVLKPGTTTTAVTDNDIVYLKQVTGATLGDLGTITLNSSETGDYIVKIAGKQDGLSVISTGIVTK